MSMFGGVGGSTGAFEIDRIRTRAWSAMIVAKHISEARIADDPATTFMSIAGRTHAQIHTQSSMSNLSRICDTCAVYNAGYPGTVCQNLWVVEPAAAHGVLGEPQGAQHVVDREV